MCQKTHILTKKCNFEYGFSFLEQTVQKHNAVSIACFNDICFKSPIIMLNQLPT